MGNDKEMLQYPSDKGKRASMTPSTLLEKFSLIENNMVFPYKGDYFYFLHLVIPHSIGLYCRNSFKVNK